MSYILEALKKSQKDRELGQIPDLTTEPYIDSSGTRSSTGTWIISSVGIALVALLIALYVIFGRQLSEPEAPQAQSQGPMLQQRQPAEPAASKTTDQATASAQLQEPVSPNAKAEPSSLASGTLAKPAAPVEKKVSVQAPTEKAPVAASPAKPPLRQTEVERIRQEYARMQAREKQQEKERKTQAIAGSPPVKTAEPVKDAPPTAHGLPTDVQSRLPPRNIMLQSYSENPAESFVILNSVKLHPGQSSADGLRVLEIRADGLLLQFEAYKFFQPR